MHLHLQSKNTTSVTVMHAEIIYLFNRNCCGGWRVSATVHVMKKKRILKGAFLSVCSSIYRQ